MQDVGRPIPFEAQRPHQRLTHIRASGMHAGQALRPGSIAAFGPAARDAPARDGAPSGG